jgi:hypothetical protein
VERHLMLCAGIRLLDAAGAMVYRTGRKGRGPGAKVPEVTLE